MTLCFECVRGLQQNINQLTWLIPEVQVDVVRQAKKYPPGQNKGNAETPLAFDSEASEVAWIMDSTVRAWADSLGLPFTVPAQTARNLSGRVLDLAKLEDAGQCADEFRDAARLGMRQIDRRTGNLYLGECQCGQRIYAQEGAQMALCVSCGTSYMVEAARRQNQALGASWPVTAREAVRYLGEVHGRMLTVGRICTWARRGKITNIGKHPDTGEYLYKLGDILRQSECSVSSGG